MGFAAPAAFALLFVFAVGAAGILMESGLRAQRELQEAARAQAEHGMALRTGDLKVHNRTWSTPGGVGQLELRVNNTGGHTFDADLVDVVLDGVLRTDKVTTRTIGGASTHVWAPGDQLYLKLEGLPASEPARAWVVADTGAVGVG